MLSRIAAASSTDSAAVWLLSLFPVPYCLLPASKAAATPASDPSSSAC
jgi:hypothetical protein